PGCGRYVRIAPGVPMCRRRYGCVVGARLASTVATISAETRRFLRSSEVVPALHSAPYPRATGLAGGDVHADPCSEDGASSSRRPRPFDDRCAPGRRGLRLLEAAAAAGDGAAQRDLCGSAGDLVR